MIVAVCLSIPDAVKSNSYLLPESHIELRDPPHPFILLAYAQHLGRMRTQFF
jgi:hypothetical protein